MKTPWKKAVAKSRDVYNQNDKDRKKMISSLDLNKKDIP
jgi:hypothetical protein